MDRTKYLDLYVEKFFLHRKMWEAEWAKTQENGLSSNQAIMLMILNEKGPLQAKDFMGVLGLSSGGVTVISDKLAELGFIRKTKDDRDRRAVNLEITERGRERIPHLRQDWVQVMETIFSPLTDAEVAMLAQLFGKLVDAQS